MEWMGEVYDGLRRKTISVRYREFVTLVRERSVTYLMRQVRVGRRSCVQGGIVCRKGPLMTVREDLY